MVNNGTFSIDRTLGHLEALQVICNAIYPDISHLTESSYVRNGVWVDYIDDGVFHGVVLSTYDRKYRQIVRKVEVKDGTLNLDDLRKKWTEIETLAKDYRIALEKIRGSNIAERINLETLLKRAPIEYPDMIEPRGNDQWLISLSLSRDQVIKVMEYVKGIRS